MRSVFSYAKKQLFDMQFEPFAYRDSGLWYVWQGSPLLVVICGLLLRISEGLAYFVFSRFTRVTDSLGAKALLISRNLTRTEDGFSIDVDYDDVAGTILTINITNNSGRAYNVVAQSTSTQRTYTLDVPANTTINQNIPQGAAAKLGIFMRSSGRIDGVEWSAS